MSETGRRETKKRATRAALEAAALTMFRERGYDATTVDDISEVAGVSARTFFRYYATKDDVLFSDHKSRMAKLQVVLAERPVGEPIRQAFDAIVAFMAADLSEHRDLVKVQTSVAGEKLHVLGVFREHQAEIAEIVVRFVKERTHDDDPRELRSRVMVSAALGAFLAAARWWAVSGCEDDLGALAAEAVAVMRTMVVPVPAPT